MKKEFSISKFIMLGVLLCFYSIITAQDLNIQHIQDDIGSGVASPSGFYEQTNTSLTPVSSTTNAFALPTNNRKTHAGRTDLDTGPLEGNDMAGARVLTSTNTLTYYREPGSISDNMRFNTDIWEYTGASGGVNEFIVRGRYAALLDGVNFVDIDLSLAGIITPNKCIPIITGIMNDDDTNGADSGTGIAYLTSNSNLIVRKGTNSNNVTIYITLVEFTGSNWTVLHGDTTSDIATGSITLYDGYDASGTETSVSDWSESIIFTQSKAETATSGGEKEGIRSQWPIISPGINNSTVNWTFDAARVVAANSNRHFIHVLNNPDLTITRFTDASFANGETTIDITSAGLTDMTQSSIIGSFITGGNGKGYAQGYRNYYLNSTLEAAHWCAKDGNSGGVSHNIQTIDFSALTAVQTEGPGGITSNLELWLKADTGIEELASDSAEDTDPVLNWLDNTINNNNATQTNLANRPIFNENVINFNPMIDFDGSNHEMTANLTSNSQMTIFAVTEGTYTTTKNLLHLDNGANGAVDIEQFGATSLRGRYTDNTATISGDVNNDLTSTSSGIPHLVNYRHLTGEKSRLFINGVLQTVPGSNTNPNTLSGTLTAGIGADLSDTSTRWDGGIAEMIVYNYKVPLAERIQIESYLGIKYGLTLGVNGTSQDYVDSDGTTIWDQSDNIGFNYNVTGIGQDDDSQLNQKQSKTINTTDDITIGIKDIAANNSLNANSFFVDKTFLLWGHDNGLTTTTTDITKDFGTAGLVSSVSVTPIERKWKMVVTDSVPTIKLSIPKSMVSSTNPGGEQYVMIIADDASFTTNVTSATMEDIGATLEVDFYFEGTKYITFGSTPEVTIGTRSAYFDNLTAPDAYLDAGDVNDLDNTDFTISAWVKRNAGQNKFDIVSKRNYFNEDSSGPEGYTHGYAFRINQTNQFRMVWKDPNDSSNNIMETSATIPENEWHHIAATYDSGTNMTRLYIDGYLEDSDDTLDPIETPSDSHFLIGAVHHVKRQQQMRGHVDEVRVWNVTLSEDQIRYIMNQEIENNSNFVDGAILPTTTTKNEIIPIPWNNLIAYYKMNTLVFGSIKDTSNSGNDASMINYNNLDDQTAPLPYKTSSDGDWDDASVWENGDVQYLPGVDSYLDALETIDYNIVQIDHNITMDNSDTALIPATRNGNRTVFGLIINSGGRLQINGNTASNTGFGLTVSHYLKLDGVLDLEGESQLIQTTDSDLDPTSSGSLERDQQGNSNAYLYNYWCSPVGKINSTSNNNDYKLPDVFSNIGFNTSGPNGTISPLEVADEWIWKYANLVGDAYSLWQPLKSTGDLSTGEGFTMKGVDLTAASTTKQNYILSGKPNNGDFTLALAAGNEYLVGNPYPSAMDANAFIRDNISEANGGHVGNITNVINGALYFWDHFANNTHELGGYEGGYAIYTLMGGTVAISNDVRINASGQVGTKAPQQYIPVGQGFFVSAIVDDALTGLTTVNGGNIQFKNSQRVFKKESASESLFLKTNSKTATSIKNGDTRQKIRLMYDSPNGYHRQLLVGIDANASNNFDLGYDALLTETNIEDMYWQFNDGKFIIQAVNNFDKTQTLPLGIKTSTDGLATIRIDELEHIIAHTNIYIHDKTLDIYHDLKQNDYVVYLSAGAHSDRFELTFEASDNALSTNDLKNKNLEIYFSNEKESLIIHNPDLNYINSINIYNILGQSIIELNNASNKNIIEHKIKSIKEGLYIIKIKTPQGLLSKKVLVK